MKIRIAPVLALAVGLAAGTAFAQSPAGNIIGDAKSGDVVVVENTETGQTRQVEIKKDGRYQLRNLPPGNFEVTVRHADGSSEAKKQVFLRAGTTARVK